MIAPELVFGLLPAGLRTELFTRYRAICQQFLERRWGPSELDGGKFCEVAYTILDGANRGTFPPQATKPRDFVTACRDLEKVPSDPTRVGDRSLRVLIPRVLTSIYEIRNQRGVAHVGGDVDPNQMDATAVHSMSSWVMAELVRIFHQVELSIAQELVNRLTERRVPLIWSIGSTRRVLDPNLDIKDQVLLLLYSGNNWVKVVDLFSWVEYSELGKFRSRILEPLHASRAIEYDEDGGGVHISPRGAIEVESRLRASLTV